jgi:E3 ubiquitin-protein ligase DOA10
MNDATTLATPRECGEVLSDPDGFQTHCREPYGTEHSHHDLSAREAAKPRRRNLRQIVERLARDAVYHERTGYYAQAARLREQLTDEVGKANAAYWLLTAEDEWPDRRQAAGR